ncbi:hypothetical protein TeGR_g10581 [Tetraparma gracilis]|uniref:RAP domain-containing protein n=1 Tax=Tetraparma gracilis TaxID=2962635 RepID=A0ABQ6MBY7_9STRA|nr:hypothetical protein TeGR_g10581 [Tetraparma gracilis]
MSAAQGDYRALLTIFSSSHTSFNDVCFATLMSRLGRLRDKDLAAAKRDERYGALLAMLPAKLGSQQCSSRVMANIAHALSKMNERREGGGAVLDAVEARADFIVETGRPQEIGNVAWAFASLGKGAPKLFSAIDSRAAWLVDEGDGQAVSNVAWALAELGVDAPNFWSCLEERGGAFAAAATPQSVCNTAWALAVSGRAGANSGLLRVLWDKAVAAVVPGTLRRIELYQLLQVRLHAESEGVDLLLPGPLEEEMYGAALTKPKPAWDTEFEFENRVASHLDELGVEYEREFPAFGEQFGGVFAVDFALRAAADGTRTAIECDGPCHFLWLARESGRGRANGRAAAKRRLLEQRGWRVVSLSWFERDRIAAEGGALAVKQWIQERVVADSIEEEEQL